MVTVGREKQPAHPTKNISEDGASAWIKVEHRGRSWSSPTSTLAQHPLVVNADGELDLVEAFEQGDGEFAG